MITSMSKAEARAALAIALDKEGKARVKLGRTEMMDFPYQRLGPDRDAVFAAVMATKEAVEAFATACEEEIRASIVSWIAAAPARMEAQKAAGAKAIHYMHEIGMRTAATDIAESIRNKADLEKEKAGQLCEV